MAVNEAMEQKYKKRDDASARLGEKMLQGWTLLGITCPNDGCFTPFVRNKQGKMYCVNCDQYAVTEEEAKKERELQEQQQERDDSLAAQQAHEQQEREQRIAQRFREEEQRKLAEQQQFERARAASQASVHVNGPVKRKSEQVPLGSQADDDRVKAHRHQTLAALYQKMEELTNSLSSNDHSERLVSIAKTIRELAEAIKVLSFNQ